MTPRAVQIDLAEDLSPSFIFTITLSFAAGFVLSDNGTQFKGAAHFGTQMKFVASSAPLHDDIFKSAVRLATKYLLRIITRVETCLKSRPIVASHDDPEGGLALTPGDFIIADLINCHPELPVLHILYKYLHY